MTNVAADARPATTRNPGLIQALATALGGYLAFIGGTLLYAALLSGFAGDRMGGAFVQLGGALGHLAVSPALLAWTSAVILTGLIARAGRSATIVRWALVLAVPATLVGIAVAWPGTFSDPGTLVSPAFWLLFLWQAAGLVGAAAIGCLIGIAVRRRTLPRAATAAGILLFVGAVAAFALPAQWMDVYFTLTGTRPVPTDAETTRYLVTALIAGVGLAGSLVFAIVSRRRSLIVLTAVALVFAALGMLVFRVG